MLREPTRTSEKLSKKSPGKAGEAQGGSPGGAGGGGAVGRGRGSSGSKAGDEAGVGTGGKETCSPFQERIQVDLPLRLRAARERGGFLACPAHGQRGAILDGSRGVR